MDDNDPPLSFEEAVQAMTERETRGNPQEDNPPSRPADGQNEPLDDDDDLVQELAAEEDQDNPQEASDEGPPEEPEEEQERDSKGRFVSDDSKTRLEDGRVITLGELKRGTLLQSDYSRKTAEVAEERKAVQAYKAQLATVENALAQERETLALVVQAYLPKPPDPSMMDHNSPNYDFMGYMAQKD